MFTTSTIDPAVTGKRDERKHVVVRFFTKSVHDPKLTRDQKSPTPLFRDEEYVELKFRGDAKSVNVAPAHDRAFLNREPDGPSHWSYAEFYHEQYDAFKAGEAQRASGAFTPLEMMTDLSPSLLASLKAKNIHSIEALAEIEPQHLRGFGTNGQALRTKAEDYIEAAKQRFDTSALMDENVKMRAEIEQLRSLVTASDPVTDDAPGNAGHSEFAAEFESWSNDALRSFITDQTGEEPSKNIGGPILKKMAAKVAAEKAGAKAA